MLYGNNTDALLNSYIISAAADAQRGMGRWGSYKYGVFKALNQVGQFVPIKECRVEVRNEVCRLQFSTVMLQIVIMCNAVKAICMILTLLGRKFIPLVII